MKVFVLSDSPLAAPASYIERRAAISSQAAGIGRVPRDITYLEEENDTWRRAHALLTPLWEQHAASPLRAARRELALSVEEIPQLAALSSKLHSRTGFVFAAVPGTVTGREFFAALAQRVFPSTQFIRWSGDPLYTPAPDVLHEVGGHGIMLANSQLAELHHLAGLASLVAPEKLTEIAAVFWYSIEFGVLRTRQGPKAYGTGLLSSAGELASFADHAEIRPINIDEMIATHYDINTFQPVLFGAASIDEVFEVVGGFYRSIIRSIGNPDSGSTVTQSQFGHAQSAPRVTKEPQCLT